MPNKLEEKHPIRTQLKNVNGRDPITAMYEKIKSRPSHVELDLHSKIQDMIDSVEMEAKILSARTGQQYLGIGKNTVVVPVQNPDLPPIILPPKEQEPRSTTKLDSTVPDRPTKKPRKTKTKITKKPKSNTMKQAVKRKTKNASKQHSRKKR